MFRSLGCKTEWTGPNEDTLLAYNIQPAIVPHPTIPDLQLWCNMAHAGAPFVTYASGRHIEQEVVDELHTARLAAVRVLRLQAGDVLVLDNYRCEVCMCP